MLWRAEIKAQTWVYKRIFVYMKIYYCTSQKDLLHMLHLPTHLSKPIVQSLTSSIYVIKNYFYEKWSSLCLKSHTWEEHVSVSCLERSVLLHFFFYCLHPDPALMSQQWWHLLSPLLPFHGKVRTFLRIHPGRTLYPCLWTCSRFQFRRLGRGMIGGGTFHFKRPTPHPVVSKKVSKQNTCAEILQPNDVNYNLL